MITQLTDGTPCRFSSQDADIVTPYRWSRHPSGYAQRRDTERGVVLMHREIMGDPYGLWVHHWNGDKLDNRRANLVILTASEHARCRPLRKDKTSQYRGVSWQSSVSKWRADLHWQRKQYYLGLFDNEEEAAEAYRLAVIKLVP